VVTGVKNGKVEISSWGEKYYVEDLGCLPVIVEVLVWQT
jgi:hypothetical protein